MIFQIPQPVFVSPKPASTLRLLFCIGLVLWSAGGYAQRAITTTIIEKTTGSPISEANVRVENASAGGTSDNKGRVSIRISNDESSANLVVSHLGYQTKTVPVAQVGTEIQLEEQVYQIGEVAVKYVDLRRLLLRTWKVDDTSVGNVTERILARTRDKDPDNYEKLAKNPEAMHKAVKLIRLVFHDDGTARVKALLFFGQTFTWQINDDDRTLVLIDNEGKEGKQTIGELTEKRLTLKAVKKDGAVTETNYIAAN